MIHLVTCQLGLLRERMLPVKRLAYPAVWPPGGDARLSTGKLLGIRICASHTEAFLYYLQVSGQEHRRAEGDAGVASGIVVAQIAEADYVGGAAIVSRIVLQLFGFGHRILRPTQIHTSEVGFLGGESDGRFFGLVVNLHLGFGIDLGRERIDVHGGEESGRFYDPVPAKWDDPVGVCGNSNRISSLVIARLERGYSAAMLIVAKSPAGEDGEHCENRGQSSSWLGVRAFVAGADLFVDQRK